MSATLRATVRLLVGVAIAPLFLLLVATQAVVGRLTGNDTAIPNLLYATIGRLLGIKVVWSESSRSVVRDKPVWYVANHQSMADFIVLGGAVNGTFAGRGDILKWPLIAQLARAVKYIGLRRTSEFNPQSRAKIIKNFNAGYNTIMFPEGTTTSGKVLALFRAAMFTILYGDKGVDKEGRNVALAAPVVVQPIAIRVNQVNGRSAIGDDELRERYAMYYEERTIPRVWKRLQVRSIVVELTAFDPLDPGQFADEKALINAAALAIASVINPGQTVFEKATIPR